MKRKLIYLSSLLLGMCLFTNIQVVNAASATISVSANKSSVTVGSKVSVTFKINSSSAIGAWNYQISAPSNFTFQSCSNGLLLHQLQEFGTKPITNSKDTTVTCTFKANQIGKGVFTVKNEEVDDFDKEVRMSVSVGSATVNVVKASTSTSSNNNNNTSSKDEKKDYSNNNYLKSLSVDGYKLSPEFKKNTTTYSLDLPSGVENITIKATKEDSKASIKGDGKVTVTEGVNKLEIKVTAEGGSTKTYTINATVAEKSAIKVTIGKDEFTVVRKKELLQSPSSSYKEGTIEMDGEKVPALISDITKYTLVGLKNTDGKINLYIYNDKDKSFELYKETSFKSVLIYILDDSSKIPGGYEKKEIKYNDEIIVAYQKAGDKDFYLIYGMNIETGEKNLYRYDDKEKTIQRYVDKDTKASNSNNNIFVYIIIGLVSFLIITYIVILVNLLKKDSSKSYKELKMRRIEEEIDDNPEENEEEQEDELKDDSDEEDDDEEVW